MKRTVNVQVVHNDGRPARGHHVKLELFQFLASGFTNTVDTGDDGYSHFHIDLDESGELAVWVDHKEAVKRSSPRDKYKIYLDRSF